MSDSIVRDGYSLLLQNPGKIIKTDPLYGGEISGGDESPFIGAFQENTPPSSTSHLQVSPGNMSSFYNVAQISVTGTIALAGIFGFTAPRTIAITRGIKSLLFASLGIAVYPFYRITNRGNGRESLLAIYPSNSQYLELLKQRFRQKFSFIRFYNMITRRVNIREPPPYLRYQQNEEHFKRSWFELRVLNKEEKSFQENVKGRTVYVEKKAMPIDPVEVYHYFRRKIWDIYARNPYRIAIEDLERKYEFSNEKPTFGDKLKLALKEWWAPRKFFLRFIYLKKFFRGYDDRNLRFSRYTQVYFIPWYFGLMIIPYPFRHQNHHVLGYVYTVTLLVCGYVAGTYCLPVRPKNQKNWLGLNFSDLLPTQKAKFALVGFLAWIVASEALSLWIRFITEGNSEPHVPTKLPGPFDLSNNSIDYFPKKIEAPSLVADIDQSFDGIKLTKLFDEGELRNKEKLSNVSIQNLETGLFESVPATLESFELEEKKRLDVLNPPLEFDNKLNLELSSFDVGKYQFFSEDFDVDKILLRGKENMKKTEEENNNRG